MIDINLTPFGFTPTENLAYGALLEHGPSSGYALAKKLNIARANAYQALNGLVKKSAASATDDKPQKYRPVRPEALLAHLTNVQAEKLDELERQIRAVPQDGAESVVPIDGVRALVTVATRTAARENGPVTCIGPGEVLAAIAPAWRKRAAEGAFTALWPLAEGAELPIETAGVLEEEKLAGMFADQPFLLVGSTAHIAATVSGDNATGYWVADDVLGGLIIGTARALTTSSD